MNIENKSEEKIHWPKDAVKMLIREYKASDFLYNLKHQMYRDRNRRCIKYEEIAEKLHLWIPDCTGEDVKKKINGLRSQYLAEVVKVRTSKSRSRLSDEEVYSPTVYWYPLMSFLSDKVGTANHHSRLMNSVGTTAQEKTSSKQIKISTGDCIPPRPPSAKQKKGDIMPEVIYLNKCENTSKVKDNIDISMSSLCESNIHEKFNKTTVSMCANNETLDVFGTYITTELRSLEARSNDFVIINITKRKILNVISDAWKVVETVELNKRASNLISDDGYT